MNVFNELAFFSLLETAQSLTDKRRLQWARAPESVANSLPERPRDVNIASEDNFVIAFPMGKLYLCRFALSKDTQSDFCYAVALADKYGNIVHGDIEFRGPRFLQLGDFWKTVSDQIRGADIVVSAILQELKQIEDSGINVDLEQQDEG